MSFGTLGTLGGLHPRDSRMVALLGPSEGCTLGTLGGLHPRDPRRVAPSGPSEGCTLRTLGGLHPWDSRRVDPRDPRRIASPFCMALIILHGASHFAWRSYIAYIAWRSHIARLRRIACQRHITRHKPH